LLAGAWLLAQQLGWAQGQWEPIARTFTVCGKESSEACVIDGDTLAVGKRRIRLTGFDAPELDGDCEAERQLAREARDALADWLSAGPFELDGGAEPPRDRYGRELRQARRDSEALADTMVERGLARRSAEERDWC